MLIDIDKTEKLIYLYDEINLADISAIVHQVDPENYKQYTIISMLQTESNSGGHSSDCYTYTSYDESTTTMT